MNVAILGAGLIVPDFLEAISLVDELTPYAIMGVEKDLERMQEFKAQYNIEKIYHYIDDVLADEFVEVVYVALPNFLHYEFSKKALEAKKNVICEKPFTSNLKEAQELIRVAKENGVHIFEAITNQYLPSYKKTKELLPTLGDLKIVELNYSQYSRRYDAFKEGQILPVFDPNKSGGALYDLNVYNVHFIVGLFGRPTGVHYYPNIEKGIDTSGILVLEYPTFKAVLIGAKDCKAPVCINLQGDQGYIHSDIPANVYDVFKAGLNLGEEKEYNLNEGKPRLYYEMVAFVEAMKNPVLFDQYDQHSLEVMEVLTNARNDAGIKFKGE